MKIGQAFVVEAEQVQDGRVEIVHADLVDGGLVTKFVGRAVMDAALYAAACQPVGEGEGIVVAAGFPALL